MRNLFVFSLLLGLIGCSTAPTSLSPDSATVSVPSFDDLRLGEPITHGSLVLIPVSTIKQDQEYADYVTLGQAKKEGWIEIIEIPGQEQVGSLKVHYTGPEPMILYAGELLLGGKQDRVVAKDTIVKPETTVDVMVYCVEPGRWDGQSMHFDAQDAQVPLDIKEKAITGTQQEVWDEVGGYNADLSASSGVPIQGTSLRGGYEAAKRSSGFTEGLDKTLKELKGRENVVGVVIVINGEIVSLEYFQSPRLFESSSEPVLRGALASALVEKGSGTVPPMTDIADFVSRCLRSAASVPVSDRAEMQAMSESSFGVAGGVTNVPSTTGGGGTVVHGSFYEKKDK